MKSTARKLSPFTRGVMAITLVVFLQAGLAKGADRPFNFMAPDAVDVIALLPPPPITGSPEDRADMTAVANARNFCPSNELAVALEQNRGLNVLSLAPISGANFRRTGCPRRPGFFAMRKAIRPGLSSPPRNTGNVCARPWWTPICS